MKSARVVILSIFLATTTLAQENGNYNVGVGISDVTGPSVGIGMMGYVKLEQVAAGIHMRLFSRAFIFQSKNEPLAVFVSVDIGMVDQALKYMVVNKLQEKYGPDLFTPKNVLLSATNTHSGPAGYLQYLLYGIPSLGIHKPNFDAIVDGMVESIEAAYANLQPGKIFLNIGRVEDANINRSPSAYEANPEEWKERYDSNVDKDMTLLRIESEDGTPLGSINWFAVKPASMNNSNLLISGDNKGYASMRFEHEMNPNSIPGKGNFVAAFASSNSGDVSPNTEGPRCRDSGEEVDPPCEPDNTCCKMIGEIRVCTTEKCIAYGPGRNMEESTKIIGEKQYAEAMRLFEDQEGTSEQLRGPVNFVHQYDNLPVNYTGEPRDRTTCRGALGYSFGAGTTDGPGMFNFKQGDNYGNAFWDLVSKLLRLNPTPETADCHETSNKPILLSVGEIYEPYDWAASVVETQMLRIGNLYIVAIPGEITTMAGRRLREVINAIIKNMDPSGPEPHVVIAGLSNVYSHYITTYFEYRIQRYEGASTLYGPYTLDAYLRQYSILTDRLLTGNSLGDGPTPPNLLPKQFTLNPPIVVDTAPFLKSYGDVLTEPAPEVNPRQMVTAQFVGGHPRHTTMRRGTFLIVERDMGGGKWEVVATDADWSTKFRWHRPIFTCTESVITITWNVPEDAVNGFYRIRHFGLYQPVMGEPAQSYEGVTSIFKVTNDSISTANEPVLAHPDWNPSSKQHSSTNIMSVIDFWRAVTAAVSKG